MTALADNMRPVEREGERRVIRPYLPSFAQRLSHSIFSNGYQAKLATRNFVAFHPIFLNERLRLWPTVEAISPRPFNGHRGSVPCGVFCKATPAPPHVDMLFPMLPNLLSRFLPTVPIWTINRIEPTSCRARGRIPQMTVRAAHAANDCVDSFDLSKVMLLRDANM